MFSSTNMSSQYFNCTFILFSVSKSSSRTSQNKGLNRCHQKYQNQTQPNQTNQPKNPKCIGSTRCLSTKLLLFGQSKSLGLFVSLSFLHPDQYFQQCSACLCHMQLRAEIYNYSYKYAARQRTYYFQMHITLPKNALLTVYQLPLCENTL